MNHVAAALGLLGNLAEIGAAGLAFYLFFRHRAQISAALKLLLAYSFQTTLGELKEKLERLNEYNANDPDEAAEIRNIFHEIAGQLRGNKKLTDAMPELATKIETLASAKKLAETAKRSMVAELREQLKNIEVNELDTTDAML